MRKPLQNPPTRSGVLPYRVKKRKEKKKSSGTMAVRDWVVVVALRLLGARVTVCGVKTGKGVEMRI